MLAALLWLCAPALAQDTSPDKPIVNPYAGRNDIVGEGRTQFNIHCSHCHGPNAFQGVKQRDLRRLSKRYGENMPTVFYTTVTNGREAKGMPSWEGKLPDEVLWKIFTFLQSVQK